ncbi:DUF937 domain-containing protein [Bordetella petrii]|uniref:Calcium-binding protein n=1 Tax=Bordetella petrii (strain ATCC BAA-461 / DSM 12804 / CCUG 43448 / CIP 107267 / Se-1111R) TaxID=340100 RepID=A9ISA9_BORPD|nr:DUF937 domain-containing protein [Bordetella petrii]CAP43278.1 conserved hypothetical protein [Bordetella petrii]
MNSPATLSDELFAQLQGAPMQQLSQQLGTDPGQTRDAVGAALPMLLGTLGHNAAQPQGAEALFGALQRDHAGAGADLGGLLGSLLGGAGGAGAAQADGGAILGHIFGDNQERAQDNLGQATGLGGGNAASLLKLLAPIVMAFLAQRMQGGGMDAGSLSATLGQERDAARQQGGLGGGLLGSLLDQDGDGQVGLGDLLKIGGGLLNGRR